MGSTPILPTAQKWANKPLNERRVVSFAVKVYAGAFGPRFFFIAVRAWPVDWHSE